MRKLPAISLVAVIVAAFSTFGAGTVAAYATAETESVDHFQVEGFFDIDIPGIGLLHGKSDGPIVIQRSQWEVNPNTGLQEMMTEISSMETAYDDPVAGRVTMRAGTDFGLPASSGKIVETFAGTHFPARSLFDLFVAVELPDILLGPLTNSDPLPLQAMINQYPPYGVLYNLNLEEGETVPLYDGGGVVGGHVVKAVVILVPEPSAALLLGFGLLGLVVARTACAPARDG